MRLRVHRSGTFAVDVHHTGSQRRGRQRLLVHAVDAPTTAAAAASRDAGASAD